MTELCAAGASGQVFLLQIQWLLNTSQETVKNKALEISRLEKYLVFYLLSAKHSTCSKKTIPNLKAKLKNSARLLGKETAKP